MSALKQQLIAQIADLRRRLNKIEEAEVTRRGKKFIGRCYRYRNSYGSECPGWWLFIKVKGSSGVNNFFDTFSFQKTAHNIFEVKPNDHTACIEGAEEITPAEFDAQWKLFLAEMNATAKTLNV